MIDREKLVALIRETMSCVVNGLCEFIMHMTDEEMELILHDALANAQNKQEAQGH